MASTAANGATTTSSSVVSEVFEEDSLHICRLCGCYCTREFIYRSNPFTPPVEDEILPILNLLTYWHVQIPENDGFPQNLCITCVAQFKSIFNFLNNCNKTQKEFEICSITRGIHLAKIKTDPGLVKTETAFVYIDDISDEDDDEDFDNSVNIPVKEEAKDPDEMIGVASDENMVAMQQTEQKPEPELVNIKQEVAKHEIEETFDVAKEDVKREIESEFREREEFFNTLNSSKDANDSDDDVQIVNFIRSNMDVSNFIKQEPKQEKVNDEVDQLNCTDCTHVAKSMEALQLHKKRIHDVRDHTCHICGKEFTNTTISRFKFHVRWHKLYNQVKCAQCGFLCESRSMLKEHKKARHSRSQCKICGILVPTIKLKLHMNRHQLIEGNSDDSTQTKIAKKETFTDMNGKEKITILADTKTQPMTHNLKHEEELTNCSSISLNTTGGSVEETSNLKEEIIDVGESTNMPISPLTIITKRLEASQSLDPDAVTSTIGIIKEENIFAAPTDDYVFCNEIIPNGNALQKHLTPVQHNTFETDETTLLHNNSSIPNDNATEFKQPSPYNNNNSTQLNKSVGMLTAYDDNMGALLLQDISSSGNCNQIELSHNSETFEDIYDEIDSYNMPIYACAACTQTFATIDELRVHSEIHKQQQRSLPKCHICGKIFQLQFKLNQHLKRHRKAPF